MAFFVHSILSVWLCGTLACCLIRSSAQLPTGLAWKNPVWNPSQLSPLSGIDLKIAYECLYMQNPEEVDSQNDAVCLKAVVGPTHEMKKGKSYYSPSKAYRLILQNDNNLVLYRECDGQAIFATHTHMAQSPARAVMQDDGHFLVYYNESAVPLWGTETWGYPDSQVFLSDSGYFYLCNRQRGCYWRSESQHTKECNVTANHVPHSQYEYKVLAKAGENVALNGVQYSPNNKFYFQKFQTSLVVWRDCDHRIGIKAIWPIDKGIGRATVQVDGNLVIYDGNAGPMWSSHTWNPPHAAAELRFYDNGFLYLCSSADGCYWQSSGFMDTCPTES